MDEINDTQSTPPEPLGKFSPPEASDKKAELQTPSGETAFSLFHDEVTVLRKAKQSVSEPDSLNGRVDDYSNLIASLAPQPEIVDQPNIEPRALSDAPTLIERSDAKVASPLSNNKVVVPLAIQDDLIASAVDSEPLSKPDKKLNFSPQVFAAKAGESVKLDEKPEVVAIQQPALNPSLGKVQSNIEIGTQVAFNQVRVASSPQLRSDVQIASAPAEQKPEISSPSSPARSLPIKTPQPDSLIASVESSSPPTPASTPPKPTELAFSKQPAFQPDAGTINIATNFDSPQITSTSNRERIASQVSNPAVSPTRSEPTESTKIIASNPTLSAPSGVEKSGDKIPTSNNESSTKASREQIASNTPNVSSEGLPSRTQEFSRSSQAVPTSSIDRSGVIASAMTSDSSSKSFEPSPRETSRESFKEKDKDKDFKDNQAPHYPKFGGASVAEESSRPIVPQQKPNFQSTSLAKESGVEKGQSLSEAIVSGKLLQQSGSLGNKSDIRKDPLAIESKSADGKIIDAKTATDAKIVDSKHSELRNVDGKQLDTRDLRTFEASTLRGIPPVIKSTDAKTQAEVTSAIPVQSNLPGTPERAGQDRTGLIQPTNSSASQTDALSPDKTGKKPQDGSEEKKETQATAKAPGSTSDTSKVPGSKAFNDLLDFIDKADGATDVKPGGKGPLTGVNILSPDDVLISGTAAASQGIPGGKDQDGTDDTDSPDTDKLSRNRKKYIVQTGDTLETIAVTELGDARFSVLILTINQAQIPTRQENGKIIVTLQPGQILWLPSEHEVQVHAELYLLDDQS